MRVIQLLDPLLEFCTPLTCPFPALLAVLLVPVLLRHVKSNCRRAVIIVLGAGLLFAVYHAACVNTGVKRWLEAVNTPFVAVYWLLILPALYLPRGRWYKVFLVIPAAIIVLAVMAVFDAYRTVPKGQGGFHWFLIRPAYLMGGIASLLVLIQPFVSLKWFRFAVRLACLLVVVYGGFAFRQDYSDYRAMLERRRTSRPGIMNLSETSPVLQSDKRMLYLPSAPCRFTGDGGYVQGCNLEMFQRLMQVDLVAVRRRDPGAVGTLSVVVGAVVLFLTLCFLAGRWCCGWVCPLSTLGGVLDWFRRRLGLPHLKPAQPVKLAYLFSGLSFAGLALVLAKAYPHLDADGKFAGCKIPLYPFCKICPGQQVCPVAAHGLGNYPGIPTWEWGFGFFRIASVTLLVLFAFSFMASRRLWCRLCPMGMISGLFNRGGALTLAKDPQKCNQCGVCADVCPMDIDLVRAEMQDRNVSSFECVLCLKCVEKCPRDGCLSLEHAGVKVVESRFETGGAVKERTHSQEVT